MKYSVEIFDDELPKSKWRAVAFELPEIADKEVYRALMGAPGIQPVIRKTTESFEEARSKYDEMKKNGWKARLVEVTQ